jgi:hypothetical protein
MKRPLNLIAIALMFASLPVLAADKATEPPQSPPKGSTPVPDGAPVASEVGEPSITIRNKGRERIEEYRLKGKLYMVRIVPPKGKPYYLIDQMGRGEFTRHEGPAAPTAVPQWVIGTF